MFSSFKNLERATTPATGAPLCQRRRRRGGGDWTDRPGAGKEPGGGLSLADFSFSESGAVTACPQGQVPFKQASTRRQEPSSSPLQAAKPVADVASARCLQARKGTDSATMSDSSETRSKKLASLGEFSGFECAGMPHSYNRSLLDAGISGRPRHLGSLIEPSACCPFSISAIRVRETATAVPLSMWTYWFLPDSESL